MPSVEVSCLFPENKGLFAKMLKSLLRRALRRFDVFCLTAVDGATLEYLVSRRGNNIS